MLTSKTMGGNIKMYDVVFLQSNEVENLYKQEYLN